MGIQSMTPRKCVNEDAIVNMLKEYDILEIGTEYLSIESKLAMVAHAEVVVGMIGKEMCNRLDSPQTTKCLWIVTPGFHMIDDPMKNSMDHTQMVYSHSTHPIPCAPYQYSLYTRVTVTNPTSPAFGQVGEIEEHCTGAYIVRMLSKEARLLYESELAPIDNSQNSPYVCDIEQLNLDLKKLLESTH